MMNLQTIKMKDLNENVKELLSGGVYNCNTLDLAMSAPTYIPYGKKIYMKKGKDLVAVKILMASYFTKLGFYNFEKCKIKDTGWCLLIQTPYGTEWRNDLYWHDARFFYSKEDYFNHLENGKGGFEIEFKYLTKLLDKSYGWGTICFKQSWEWNGHCAEQVNSKISNIIINENGVNVIIDNCKGRYWTKEDCIKANIDGMKIIDFPETDDTIKVTIEVIPSNPIVRTISFIEQ